MAELGRALASWLVERGVDTDVAGSSLAAKWLWRTEPNRWATTSTATGEHHEPPTLVSSTLHGPHSPRRHRWLMSSAVAAAALGPLLVGLAARGLPSRDYVAASAVEMVPITPIADVERGCVTPAAIPTLAAAPFRDGPNFFDSTAGLERRVQAAGTIINATQAARPSRAPSSGAHSVLPF